MMVLYEHTKRTQDTETIVKRLESEVDELKARLNEKDAASRTGAQEVPIESGGAGAGAGECVTTQAGHCGAAAQRFEGAVGAVVGVNQGTVIAAKNQVVINVFGAEEVSHATTNRIQELMDETLEGSPLPVAAQAAVLKAAMLIFSNPDHPENLTAYLPNKKLSDVMVHGEKGWEVQPAGLVLAPMALKALDVLFDKQPYERAEDYTALMVELRDNEARYAAGEKLRPILVRNRDLLAKALGTLPVAR